MAYANMRHNSGKNLTYASVDQGSAGTTEVAPATAGKKHKLISAILVLDAAGTLKFQSGSTDITGAMSVSSTGGLVAPPGVSPYTETAVGEALNLTTATGAAAGVVSYITE